MFTTDESRWNLDNSSHYYPHNFFINFKMSQKHVLKQDPKAAAPILSPSSCILVSEKKMLGATAATGNKRKVRIIWYVTCGWIFCKMLPKTTTMTHQEKQKQLFKEVMVDVWKYVYGWHDFEQLMDYRKREVICLYSRNIILLLAWGHDPCVEKEM